MSLVSEVNVQIDSQRLYEEYLMVKEIADEINSKKNSFSNDIQYVLRILLLSRNDHLSFSKSIIAIRFGLIQPFYLSGNFHITIFDVRANL